jgi:hypothetical protein
LLHFENFRPRWHPILFWAYSGDGVSVGEMVHWSDVVLELSQRGGLSETAGKVVAMSLCEEFFQNKINLL